MRKWESRRVSLPALCLSSTPVASGLFSFAVILVLAMVKSGCHRSPATAPGSGLATGGWSREGKKEERDREREKEKYPDREKRVELQLRNVCIDQ